MNVGKNNFRPPPNVESSVVRIVPLDPPPPIKFEEFDGLTRILFSRRNKTVHGNFMAKGVVDMLEKNWRTWCAENNIVSNIDLNQGIGSDCARKTITDDVDMKTRIEKVLEETGNTENRAAKMGVDDILKCVPCNRFVGVRR